MTIGALSGRDGAWRRAGVDRAHRRADQASGLRGPGPEGLASAEAGMGLLGHLWRFRAYGRSQLRPLLVGVGMRVGELATDLAAPWPLALVIDDVVRG